MRWIKKKEKRIVGVTRIVRRFLFFPTIIDNENRWLEWATIKQITEFQSAGYETCARYYWRNIEWIKPLPLSG